MNSDAMMTSAFVVQPSWLPAGNSVVVQPSRLHDGADVVTFVMQPFQSHEEAGETPAPQ